MQHTDVEGRLLMSKNHFHALPIAGFVTVMSVLWLGAASAAPASPSPAIPKLPVPAGVSAVHASATSAFQPLAPAKSQLDISTPNTSMPPVPNVSAYKAELDRMGAYQRESDYLGLKNVVANKALLLAKTLVSFKKEMAMLNAPIGDDNKKMAAARNTAPKSSVPKAAVIRTAAVRRKRDRRMEVLQSGCAGGSCSATVYVAGVGPRDVRIGSVLPGNEKVIGIRDDGIDVMSHGKRAMIGMGAASFPTTVPTHFASRITPQQGTFPIPQVPVRSTPSMASVMQPEQTQ